MASLSDLFSIDSSIRVQRDLYRSEMLQELARKVAKDVADGTARDVAVYSFAGILKALVPQGKGSAEKAEKVANDMVDSLLDELTAQEETEEAEGGEVTADGGEDNGEETTEETSQESSPRGRKAKAA